MWKVILCYSVVEPFHFGPATAPACQNDSGSSSSSSPVVHNLLLKKKVFKNLTSQFTGACFIQKKVRVLCFALPVLYLKRQINFILHFFYIICLFLFFKHGVRAGAWAVELEPETPLFSRLRPKRAAPAPAPQHCSPGFEGFGGQILLRLQCCNFFKFYLLFNLENLINGYKCENELNFII